MAKRQNECLNFLKGIACILIVYLHMGFPEPIGSVVSVISKMSVQLFFMISGYFAWSSSNETALSKMPAKLKHTLVMIGWAVLFSTMYHLVIASMQVGIIESVRSWFGVFDLKNTLKFVGLTATSHIPGWGVLWFLFSLLYCYVAYAVVLKLKWIKLAYGMIVPILLFHLGVRYFFVLSGVSFGSVYFQNWLLNGIPFFFLGHWIHAHRDQIVSRCKDRSLLIVCLGGIVLANVEAQIMGYMSFYFGTILQVVSLFIFALRNPEQKVCRWLAKIGEKDCFFVYIAHPIVGGVIGMLAGGLKETVLYPYLFAAIVVVVCVVLSRCVDWLKSREAS